MKLTLGEECLILRRRSGLFISHAAKAMKVCLSTISNIELERGRYSHEKALKYRDFLMSKQRDISP